MKLSLAIASLALLAGCATTPPADVLATADYGNYPSEFKEVIKAYTAGILKDPDSAKYEFLNYPVRGYWGLGGPKYGYVVCANINAKNGFGGYTGSKVSYFMIRNGVVIDASISSDGSYGETIAAAKCRPYPRDKVV